MKTINICIALVGIILLGSCAVTDIDKSADFNQYSSFSFAKPVVDVNDPAFRSELIDDRIKSALKDEFQKRGLVYAQRNGDMVVTYQTYTKEKTYNDYGGGYMPYGYWYSPRFFWGPYWGPYWGYPYRNQQSYQYTEGTLIVDINDRKTGDHIWRGMVRGRITESAIQKQVEKAVKAIAKKYPVKENDRLKLPDKDDVT